MNYLDILIIFFGIAFSFLLLHFADHGMQFSMQLRFLIIPVVVLVLYELFAPGSAFKNLGSGFLTLPFFIVALLNVLNIISWKVNKREFRLKIRGSRNLYAGNTNWLDMLFSFFLVISFFAWPIAIALILKGL